MLILFFTIVFIAELIITVEAVKYIKIWDKKVCEINNQIAENISQTEKTLLSIRISVNKISLQLNKIEQKIKQKKEQYKIIILKNIIAWALLLMLNVNSKKLSGTVDLIFALADIAKIWEKKFAQA